MSRKLTALSSKGGVGKTTTLANLGGVLADIGARVLLLDADPQPSLSKYYPLEYEAPKGLVEVITEGYVDELCISRTTRRGLHLIKSNDGKAGLQFWLHGRPDQRTRLADALRSPVIDDNYDFIIIDTQGAIGPLQTAAAFAADTLLSPLPPDTPSIREFTTGTLKVLRELTESGEQPNEFLAPIKVVIAKADFSRDGKTLLNELRAEYAESDQVEFLDQMIPNAVAYREAYTRRIPVHEYNMVGGVRLPSGFEVMHRLAWALYPHLYGWFAGQKKGDPELVFGITSEANDDAAAMGGAAA
jgi:chromosome partitioning related protein ParA